MEKQRSFSIKPIRFWVLSFTISFSVIFLIFFSTWVFKTTPQNRLGSHNLVFNSTYSDYVLKNSILMGTHLRSDEISSESTDSESRAGNSILTQNLSGDSVNCSNSTKQEFQELKGVIDTGNSTLTQNLSGDGVNSSNSTNQEFQELNDVIDVVQDNSTAGKKDMVSGVSFQEQEISSRNNIVEKKDNNVVCDVTKGSWVFDENYPLYTNVTCPFIDEGFNCVGNGRLNKDYMNWRWQPQDCDIPRFNATKMLELIRGKRVVFVGDSLNRNQWESMLCLLMGGVKDPKKVYEARGRKITKERGNYCFKFEDYECTVEYYVSHYLVHESRARTGKKRVQTLRIDAIDKGSSRWRGADILVFNTAHWWSHSKTKAGINYYQERDQLHPRLDVTIAFQRALSTWAAWIDKNINPRKTRVFFRSSAPAHFSGGLWNSGGHCKEAFRPINGTFTSNYPEKNSIVEGIIRQMKTPVTFLNITWLSDYRPDAHPSIYGRKSVNPGVQDCSHWCLPGVPDNWNELLYYYLQLRTKDSFVV